MINYYKSQENVMIRVALGNIEEYEGLSNEYIENGFQEAVLVASESLYNAFQKKRKNEDAVLRSILKYKIRNATRCTPYGLFAGVGMIEISDQTTLEVNNRMIKKRARVDMKWLFQYISMLLHNENILSHLKLKYNELCYICGDRVINPNFFANGNTEEVRSSSYSIRYNKVIEFIMSSSREYVGYMELIKKISEKYDVNIERAKKCVDELVEYGFFIVEILPPLINTNAMDYVIQILNKRLGENDYSRFLENLVQKIDKYNNTLIGEGTYLYKSIVNDMKKVIDMKEYLQVDTKIDFHSQTISKKMAHEIERTINFLAQFAAGYQEQGYITQYKQDFLEKYGYNTEVLILEMLDNNIGIGIPANYKNSQRKHMDYEIKNEMLEAVNRIISNRALTALKDNKSIIYLTDGDIDTVNEQNIKSENLLNSADIVVQPLASSMENIDNGEFNLLLSGCISSAGALNLLGRFSDMFWENKRYDYTSIEHEQKLLGEDYIIAELVEIFRTGRTANVDMNMNSIPYQICICCNPCEGKDTIGINDIYIGVDKKTNQFYAKSKKFNKRIYAKTTHMLNNFFGSAAYRFLRDISSLATKFQFGEIVTSLGNSDWEHFPRIMYRKTILRPEKWTYFNSQEKDFGVWDEKFSNWVKVMKVPNYVNYTVSDHYLRLNLSKKEHRELVYYDSLKAGIIVLREDFISEKTVWLEDEQNGKHCCEIVFSFNKKKNKDAELDIDKIPSEKPYYFSDTQRTLFPGEDGWYYYKLYGMKGREDEFIGIDFKDFVDKLTINSIIDKHYFIRYKDTHYHTRVRFHVCKNKDNEFYSKFHCWLLEEKVKGMLTDLSSSVYEREIERYGGRTLISFAEDVFWKDSLFVELVKEKLYNGEIKVSDEEIAIWSVWGILHGFGLKLEDAEKWLSKTVSKNEHRDFFKKNEKKLRRSLKMSSDFCSEIKFLYEDRNEIIRKFYFEIIRTKEENLLSNTVDDILSTLIHMFCNRYAANNNWERKIRALTRHTLYSEVSYRHFYKE